MQEASWVNDMLLFGVQVQSWVYQRNGPADAAIPVLAPDFVQRPVDVGPALDKIRSKYGYRSIRRAIALVDPALDLDAKEEHIIHPTGFLGTLHE